MADPIRVDATVVVPASAIAVSFARSSGPGGQNVNKVESKVILRFEVAAVRGLDDASRARLRGLAGSRLDQDGWILVTSQRTRDQHRNLADAREKARELVARSLRAPRKRRPTRKTRASHDARIKAKKREGAVKRLRGRVSGED
jgi:ribosome-associated protein